MFCLAWSDCLVDNESVQQDVPAVGIGNGPRRNGVVARDGGILLFNFADGEGSLDVAVFLSRTVQCKRYEVGLSRVRGEEIVE